MSATQIGRFACARGGDLVVLRDLHGFALPQKYGEQRYTVTDGSVNNYVAVCFDGAIYVYFRDYGTFSGSRYTEPEIRGRLRRVPPSDDLGFQYFSALLWCLRDSKRRDPADPPRSPPVRPWQVEGA